MVISGIVIAYVFNFLFSNSVPPSRRRSGFAPLETSILANPHTAWLAIVIVTAWQAIPGAMIIYLAGLLAIPAEVYEAASIDGASAWQQFRASPSRCVFRLRRHQHDPRLQGLPQRLRHHRRPDQRRPRHRDPSVAMTIFTRLHQRRLRLPDGQRHHLLPHHASSSPSSSSARSARKERVSDGYPANALRSRRGADGRNAAGRARMPRAAGSTGRRRSSSRSVLADRPHPAVLHHRHGAQVTGTRPATGTGFSLPCAVQLEGLRRAAWDLTNFPAGVRRCSLLVTAVTVAGDDPARARSRRTPSPATGTTGCSAGRSSTCWRRCSSRSRSSRCRRSSSPASSASTTRSASTILHIMFQLSLQRAAVHGVPAVHPDRARGERAHRRRHAPGRRSGS